MCSTAKSIKNFMEMFVLSDTCSLDSELVIVQNIVDFEELDFCVLLKDMQSVHVHVYYVKASAIHFNIIFMKSFCNGIEFY